MTTTRPYPAARRLAKQVLPVGLLGTVVGVSTEERVVAVTFDDGPDPRHTLPIVEVLSAHGMRATFFCLTEQAQAHAEVARRLVGKGHEVALHGLDHHRITLLSFREQLSWLRGGKAGLERVIGQPVRYFRPPFGAQSVRSYLLARATGLDVIGWSSVGDDWTDISPEEVVDRATATLRPGGILLLHDRVSSDPLRPAPPRRFERTKMVEILAARLRASRYRCLPVGDLLSSYRVRRDFWFPPL